MPIFGLALFVVVVASAVRAVIALRKYRGERVVVCPETRQPAGVSLDAGRAVAYSLTHIKAPAQVHGLQLASCTRWPERAGCGQQCLAHIQAAPEDCLVRNILARWYEGKSCAWCDRPFEQVQWDVRKPALLDANGLSLEWNAVPAERLNETLASARPVCFACHLATTLVREHPELTTDRSTVVPQNRR